VCVCVQQTGVKGQRCVRRVTEGTWKCSQREWLNVKQHFFGVIAIDTIGVLSCAATCGIRETDWPEEMPTATANPFLYQENKKHD
jgi:hypothetical protein